MSTSPTKRVALVSGAARGIGQAFARRLASDGYRLVIVDIERPSDTEILLRDLTAEALAVKTDVSDEAAVRDLAAAVHDRFGGCDILVNNAGTGAIESFEEMTLESWRRIMTVNLDSMFLMCRAFLPGMRERAWGRIVNMSSNTLGLVIPWGFAHYIASKGGVVGLTRALASEYGDHGVTVNAIAPGLVHTPGTVQLLGDTSGFVSAQAIRRQEVPEDLLGTLSFLVSDDAGFITGQTLTVDGGVVR